MPFQCITYCCQIWADLLCRLWRYSNTVIQQGINNNSSSRFHQRSAKCDSDGMLWRLQSSGLLDIIVACPMKTSKALPSRFVPWSNNYRGLEGIYFAGLFYARESPLIQLAHSIQKRELMSSSYTFQLTEMQQKWKGDHKIVINQPSISLHNNIVKYRVIDSLLLDGTRT